ncbi:ribosome biogenesis protein Nop53/GLTSCR2 [Clohesyomyces aquaticus]|uniref:Ribosome biogenesis protein NOP53 n=1 Tax=Clohesyomyces aquaticus TaxID=1231657 RepID=A0A1Y2A955_9PLEO|nr:ribosome biogenesis protein Nop53/GLTSCR2 [Clohesyomyces aquaticus]
MSASVAAPAQHKQPSRKGKKAWRKHVDVGEVNAGLDEVRAQIIQGQASFPLQLLVLSKDADQLFAIDTTGSRDIHADYRKQHKPLRADEILAQRSAVPAVSSRKRFADFAEPKTKKPRISHKQFDKLRSIAYGGDQVQKDVVQTGVTADHDPWAVDEAEQDPQFSFLEPKKPKREPVTLKHAPISLAKHGKPLPAVRKPEAGKSYNPTLEDWANLLEREGEKEVEAEKKRLQEAREEAERMQRAIAAQAEEDEADRNESAWESEWEGFSDADEDALKKKRPERKTPSQRNKINRRKEAERRARHEAKIKEKERQLQRIQELARSVEEKEKARAATRDMVVTAQGDSSSDAEEEVLRRKRFGRHPIPEPTLEVVLADELQDSLRRLKPEGNLLKDRFRSMIVRGKVESRRQIAQGKKPKTTTTEKWSYKDWKL